MSLTEFVDEVADRRKRITVYGPEPPDDVSELFETWNVTVDYEHLPTAPEDAFITVHEGEEFLGGVSAAALATLTAPTIGEPWGESDREESYRELLNLLDDTLFFSGNRRQLLATSREFEERAWRRGTGALHATFQSRDAFGPQVETYGRLAGQSDLTVHVYAPEEWRPVEAAPEWAPSTDGVHWHHADADELHRTWVVAYDGGDDPEQECALVAFEEEPNEYEGFWTYDPELVDDVVDYLQRNYG
ncbi:sensor protein [Halobacteriales archaeon QS_5_70_15]|nr:MAG: sensor protein [Halobacteriales archaeon QS_5_70_15]